MGFSDLAASCTSQVFDKKMKILVVGAHHHDPETTCGGIIALLSGSGHEVISVYLKKGKAGIEGKSREEAAKIRTAEAVGQLHRVLF